MSIISWKRHMTENCFKGILLGKKSHGAYRMAPSSVTLNGVDLLGFYTWIGKRMWPITVTVVIKMTDLSRSQAVMSAE